MARKFQGAVKPAEVSARTVAHFERRRSRASTCLAFARDALEGFGRGEHRFGLTKGQFSMIDLAAAALDITGPADVAVWTWCIADYEVQAITAFLQDRRLQSFRIVMDRAGLRIDMPVVAELQARFGLDCIRITFTHAKIVTLATDCGWRVVIRGSMNLNENPRFEQFDVSDDPAVFGVVDGVMADLWRLGEALPVEKSTHGAAATLLGHAGGEIAGPDWAPPMGAAWWDARPKAKAG